MTSSKKYRTALPSPDDTTSRDEWPLVTPGFLRFVGEILHGERWQTPLAHRLGRIRGKPVAAATVHQWSTRTRSIPDWVTNALALCLEQADLEFTRRAGQARSVATRIRQAQPAPGVALPRRKHRTGSAALRRGDLEHTDLAAAPLGASLAAQLADAD